MELIRSVTVDNVVNVLIWSLPTVLCTEVLGDTTVAV